jgi:hypothetical protein
MEGTLVPITELDEWYVGEDQTFLYDILQEDRKTAQNCTGWTIQFKMGRTENGVAVLTKSGTFDNAATGASRLTFAAADTSSLPPLKTYYYFLSRTNAGFNTVIARGPAVLLGRVT